MAFLGNTIPRATSEPIDPRNQAFKTEWYNFLRSLATQVSGEALQQGLLALAERVKDLEDGSATEAVIQGLNSVQTFGSLANGIVQIQLQGDEVYLGPTMFYGTGPDALRSWNRMFDAFTAGTGITITDSGYRVLGIVETSADIPGTGASGDAWRVLSVEERGLWAWDGADWELDPTATGRVGISVGEIPDTAVPYFISDGETYTVAANKQALFTIPIDIGAGSVLAVDGILAEVD